MIVVFGSINIDLVTQVDHLPRAGETVSGERYDMVPGGKGANQALAAARAGARVCLVGAVGRDVFAEPALKLLREAGVDLSGVASVDAPTGLAAIAVDSRGENQIVVATGANALASAATLEKVPFGAGDTLLMQREIPDEQVINAAALAHGRGARVVLNNAPARKIPGFLLRSVDLLVVNESEARELAEERDLRYAEPEQLATVLEEEGISVVITLGARGLVAAQAGQTISIPAPDVHVVDTTGAGDAFMGALLAALDRGDDFETALRMGIAAGGLACTRRGAQPSLPEREAVEAASARG